jgi:hypothetical protein
VTDAAGRHMSLTVHNVEYPKVACPLVRVAVKNPIIDNENLPGLMGGQGISTSNDQSAVHKALSQHRFRCHCWGLVR